MNTYLVVVLLCTSLLHADWAEKTLATMSPREKIGQLFMVAATSLFDEHEEKLASAAITCPYNMDPDHIKKLITDCHVGGIIYLYGNTAETVIDATNEYQRLSELPLMVGLDAEWGLSMRLRDTVRYPRNMALGALRDKELIYDLGVEIGRQCKAMGVQINFSPVVDVNNNPKNPVISNRAFGQDVQAVTQAGLLMAKGLQDAGVMACAKHFPGHGDTDIDSHLDLPRIPHSKQWLELLELIPFKALIDAGVGAVMTAHLEIPALEPREHWASSLSSAVVTDLLEKELHFDGLKITDGLGMEALTKHFVPGQIELEAFLAGNDILLCPLDVPAAVDLIEKAIHDGRVTEQELDHRVLRILKAKEWAGCTTFAPIDKQRACAQLTIPCALELKQQLYRQSMTLIPPHDFVPVTDADAAVVIQIGGDHDNAFKRQLEQACPCTYLYHSEELIAQLGDAQTIIVPVFGMNKFAEKNYGISPATQKFFTELAQLNKRVIVVPFGVPYSIPLFQQPSTVVLAYEDDPEAQKAAADVLTGKLQALGTSPVTW